MKLNIIDPLKERGGQEKFIIKLANSLGATYDVVLHYQDPKRIYSEVSGSFSKSNYSSIIGFIIKYFKIISSNENIIHIANGDRALLYMGLVNFIKKQRFIYVNHLVFEEAIEQKSFFWRKIYTMVYIKLIKTPEKIVCISKSNFKYLEHYNPVLIENGVEKVIINNVKKDKHSKFKIGFIGRVDYQKGIDTLLGAAKLLQSYEDISIHIYGEGPLESKLKNIANLSFYGYQSDINSIYNDIQLIVFPSKYEGLSLSLLEAMSSGVPILASDIRSFKSILSEGNIDYASYFKVDDAHDLYNQILNIYKNYSTSIEKARQSEVLFNLRYNESVMLDKYQSLIKSMNA